MKILSANYIGSYHKLEDSPKKLIPDFSFIGRSNVGKSSLINMITNRKKLAKISGAPGKTQSINFFEIKSEFDGGTFEWHLIDLPGYGYAKRSKKEREKYHRMIREVMTKRKTLACVFQLIDINVPPQNSDLENIEWMGENGIPFVLVFTKSDKQSKQKNKEAIIAFQDKMLEKWESLPRFFLTSAEKNRGSEELLEFISTTCRQIKMMEGD